MRPRTSPLEQFRARVQVDGNGCWLWTGGRDPKGGYGIFTPVVDGEQQTTRTAHRWAYETHIGPVPDGLVIDHLCRVRHCVNPAHMEPVTQSVNVRRGALGGRTECKHGHPYTPENTGRTARGRYCKRCKADRSRLARAS